SSIWRCPPLRSPTINAGVVTFMTRRRKNSSMGMTRVTADGTVAARDSDSETGEIAARGSYSVTGGAATGGSESEAGETATRDSDSETGRTATKTKVSDSETERTATNGGTDGATPAGIDAVFHVADVSDRFA